jgi:hypothetical protein
MVRTFLPLLSLLLATSSAAAAAFDVPQSFGTGYSLMQKKERDDVTKEENKKGRRTSASSSESAAANKSPVRSVNDPEWEVSEEECV